MCARARGQRPAKPRATPRPAPAAPAARADGGRLGCLLRGVNVAGKRKLPMGELRALATALGCTEVETYLQSGNLVCKSASAPAALADALTRALADQLGVEGVAVLVRTATELDALVAANPFCAERRAQGPEDEPASDAALYVTFLERSAPAELAALAQGDYGGDELAAGDRAVYLRCVTGYGDTKISNAFFEKKLRQLATTRNWRTTLALRELARA